MRQDKTCRSSGSNLGAQAWLATAGSETVLTMDSDPARVKPNPRGGSEAASTTRQEARFGNMVNTSESAINLVTHDMPNVLSGMNQKVCGRTLVSHIPKRGRCPTGEQPAPNLSLSLKGNLVSPNARPLVWAGRP